MKRVGTALLLVPTVLAIIYWGPWWVFLPVVAVVALLCFHEFGGIVAAHGFRAPSVWSYAAGAGLLVLPVEWALIALVLFTLVVLVAGLANGELSHALPQAASLVLGVVYIFGCWRCAVLLRDHSPHWLAFALALNWIGDTAALYVGRAYGRHKLAPRVSPKKTWEGAAASLAASVVFGAVFLPQALPPLALWHALLLSALASVVGQVGDLAESGLKRGASVKDSGNMLPGHGGWLDRVDSTLFAMPVVLLYLTIYR